MTERLPTKLVSRGGERKRADCVDNASFLMLAESEATTAGRPTDIDDGTVSLSSWESTLAGPSHDVKHAV